MSQKEAQEIAKLIAGLGRLVRLASTLPEELLAAWLAWDASLSKTQARQVAKSIKDLMKLLGEEV